MKKSTAFVLIGGLVAGGWAYYVTATTGEQVWMEELQRRAGTGAECTVTKNIEGRNWMACRRSQNHQGSAWLQAEGDGKPVWIAASPKADEILRDIQQLDHQDREGLAIIRPPHNNESLPPVPWDRLD